MKLDFWKMMQLAFLAKQLVEGVKKAIADDKLTEQEIVEDIIVHVLFIVELFEPNFNRAKLIDMVRLRTATFSQVKTLDSVL